MDRALHPNIHLHGEPNIKVIRVGWFAFEGFGRPWEAWQQVRGLHWRVVGRAFTLRGAQRKARRG